MASVFGALGFALVVSVLHSGGLFLDLLNLCKRDFLGPLSSVKEAAYGHVIPAKVNTFRRSARDYAWIFAE